MVSAAKLIEKFQYALNNKWGYIYGASYEKWTQAKQNALVKTFTDKYGAGWKTNANAKASDKYYSAVYGGQWVGHMVTDCSGLFYWAFKQLGGYMYHGSNTMWNKYCTNKGDLTKNGRTDGKTLKPGTAVFTGNSANKGHVGLYIGNNTVIEASGSRAGVITTKISGGKWKYWGELKGVDFDVSASSTTTVAEPKPASGYAIVNASSVAIRLAPTTSASVITRVPQGQQVKLETDPPEGWTRVEYNGSVGYMMTKFLNK